MSGLMEHLKTQLIEWNLRFPLDRKYRKKHNIVFGSDEHRAINQIDIYLEHLEENLYSEIYNRAVDNVKGEKEYVKGKWLKDDVDETNEQELFEKLKVSNLSNVVIED